MATTSAMKTVGVWGRTKKASKEGKTSELGFGTIGVDGNGRGMCPRIFQVGAAQIMRMVTALNEQHRKITGKVQGVAA